MTFLGGPLAEGHTVVILVIIDVKAEVIVEGAGEHKLLDGGLGGGGSGGGGGLLGGHGGLGHGGFGGDWGGCGLEQRGNE